MRRLECAGRDNDLASGAQAAQLLALAIFDADRALAFEQDTGGVREGFDLEVGARPNVRVDVAAGRAPALAVFLGDLIGAEAFLLLGIEILPEAELRFA